MCRYDPAARQFTQPDPIGLAGGLNLYGYAGGDPINRSDPFGLSPETLTVVGPELQKAVAAEEASSDAAKAAFDKLRSSSKHFVLFDSDYLGCPATSCPLAEFSFDGSGSDPLTNEVRQFLGGSPRGFAHVRPSHQLTRQIGPGKMAWHAAVHLGGLEDIGRLYSHNPNPGGICDKAAWQGVPGRNCE